MRILWGFPASSWKPSVIWIGWSCLRNATCNFRSVIRARWKSVPTVFPVGLDISRVDTLDFSEGGLGKRGIRKTVEVFFKKHLGKTPLPTDRSQAFVDVRMATWMSLHVRQSGCCAVGFRGGCLPKQLFWHWGIYSIEIQFWSIEFLETPPNVSDRLSFKNPGHWKGEATFFDDFSLCESEGSTSIGVYPDVRFWMKWWHVRIDGLELGIWKISGDLWTSVLIPDIQWLCGWISGDWPNQIAYHGNGSDLTGLTANFNSRVWKLWTTVSEELRSVGQDDICNTYKCIHMCMMIWHIWHIDALAAPFLNQHTFDFTYIYFSIVTQQVAHLHSCRLLRISDCENVLQIKTVWRQPPGSKRPRSHDLQHKASFWRLQGPAAKAEGFGKKGFASASWEEATNVFLQEASKQWFVQGRIKEFQWLARPLWLQWSDRKRCNRDCFCSHSESTRNALRLETNLEERLQWEDGERVFPRVWDLEKLPAS